MLEDMTTPEVSQLKRIRSLALFNDHELASLAATLEVSHARDGEKIISFGDIGNFSLYLLGGDAICYSVDGGSRPVVADQVGLLHPLAPLRPSRHSIVVQGDAAYLRLDQSELNRFSQLLEPDIDGIEVTAIEQSDEANELTIALCQEILNGSIRIPAMPDIALKIQQLFSDDNADVAILSNLIQTDPSLSAKLLRTANSVLYRGSSSVDSLQQAIVRMGLETLRKQVLVYAANEMFRETSSNMKIRMQKLWRGSRRVAAFSRILAKKIKGFDPESAQMAGLLSDLGEVAIAQYVQDHEQLVYTEEALTQTIMSLRAQINGMLMYKWNLGDELIVVAEESHDWFRNRQDEAELCDLVLIARYYSMLGLTGMSDLPVLSRLPAFNKLKAKGFNPGKSMMFLQESQSEVMMVEDLLGSII